MARAFLPLGQHDDADHFQSLSASQALAYHAEEFSNARENYYTQGDQIRGEWHGKLAEQWELRGEVGEEHSSGSRKDSTRSLVSSSSATRRHKNM